MLQYSRLQLATIIAVPIVTIILLWTVVIFYKNKKYWKCFDTAIVAVLIQSIFRNLAIISYTILQMVNQSSIRFEYCTVFVWIFNSIHTFQASTLSTLAVIALFSIKLYRKRQHLKNYLTVAHIVYHLFCLTTLCACVGVAAILAKQKNKEFVVMFDFFPLNLCMFMPYEMDIKYNVFIITLHTFLVFISFVAFMLTCYNFYAGKRDGFEYVKKSNSDLSELSIGSGTHTYQRPYYEGYATGKIENGQVQTSQGHWTSDTSNISTTVSSTNSRRPCLGKQVSEEETEGVGLETILPILTVCYLFNHAPVIVLCLFPWFIAPWSVATAALCLGLLQDILVPLSLGLVDTRFCQWVSNVYRCSDREKLNDKLPQVGLDGKFRPFGTHSPEVQVAQLSSPERQKSYHITGNEPKFPITNGSLYTSVDGRVPIIHNYRRHKDRSVKPIENNLINLGVHATYLKQQDLQPPQPTPVAKQDYVCSTRIERRPPVVGKKRVSLSQNGLNRFGIELPSHKISIGPLRLSKSEDSLCEIERGNFDQKTLLSFEKNDPSDSEDDYFSDSVNAMDANRNSDDESSKSSFSITTEANCDFEFYQAKSDGARSDDFVSSHGHETFDYLRINSHNSDDTKENIPVLQTFKPQMIPRVSTSKDNITVVSMEHLDRPKVVKLDVNRNFRITRSNSKRSLENFRAFIDDGDFDSCDSVIYPSQTQRSYSYVDLDDTIKCKNKFESAWIGLDSSCTKEVMVGKRQVNTSGSVPDLKKIFISDYL